MGANQMTWKEFKELIDKQLKEKNVDEDTEIWYVDFSFPDVNNTPEVRKDDVQGISIS